MNKIFRCWITILTISVLIGTFSNQLMSQGVALGGTVVGEPTVPFFYANGMPMPYPVGHTFASAAHPASVPGLPSPGLVPPPIAAPVLYPPYHSTPFFHNPPLVWGVVGGVAGIGVVILIHKLRERHNTR